MQMRKAPSLNSRRRNTRVSVQVQGALASQIAALAVEPSDPQTWDATWSSAFRKLRVDGEVDREKLMELLRLIGYRNPNEGMCVEVANKISRFATFGASEVYIFIQNFEEEVRAEVRREFNAFAVKNGGTVPIRELESLISKRGYTPIPHALAELLTEAVAETKENLESIVRSGGGVPLRVFEMMVDLLEQREGFCKSDLDVLEDAFERFDKNNDGVIDSRELQDVMESLDYCFDKSILEYLTALQGSNGVLTWKDFLGIMRKRVLLEFELCQEYFRRYDADGDGFLKPGECMRFFKKLSVSMLPETLCELTEECEVDNSAIDLDAFWTMLQVLRGREGFTMQEAADIKSVFNRFDTSGHGEMPLQRVRLALLWLGYQCESGVLGKVNKNIPIPEENGYITEIQFMKLARKHREAELRAIRRVFRTFADDGGAGRLRFENLLPAASRLNRLFVNECNDWMKKNRPGARLARKFVKFDFEEFRVVMLHCRARLRARLQENCGFSSVQLSTLRIEFTKHVQDSKATTVSAKGLIKLFKALVPQSQTSVEVRDRLRKALEMNNSRGGGLEWHTFLCVMRAYDDLLQSDWELVLQSSMEALKIPKAKLEETKLVLARLSESARSLTQEDVLFLGAGLLPTLDLEDAADVLDRLQDDEDDIMASEGDCSISRKIKCLMEIVLSGEYSPQNLQHNHGRRLSKQSDLRGKLSAAFRREITSPSSVPPSRGLSSSSGMISTRSPRSRGNDRASSSGTVKLPPSRGQDHSMNRSASAGILKLPPSRGHDL